MPFLLQCKNAQIWLRAEHECDFKSSDADECKDDDDDISIVRLFPFIRLIFNMGDLISAHEATQLASLRAKSHDSIIILLELDIILRHNIRYFPAALARRRIILLDI